MKMTEKKCVKLDLYIDDDEVLQTTNDENADEVLCLRILSSKTKYRFGGLKVHISSPVFNIGKIFNVEFDEDSEVALIRSQKDSEVVNTQDNSPCTSKAATIVISPDREDPELHKSPTVSADLTLIEATDSKDGDNRKNSCDDSTGERRMSQQLKRFMSKKIQTGWHSAVRVKRFFSDSISFWN
jgi:hypothetical protein